MAGQGRIVFVCSCEDTMPLDGRALARGCGGEVRTAEQLCLAQRDRFLAALREGRPLTVACTAQAPLFREEAEAAGAGDASLAFANVREHAGWSDEARDAGPKMAALIAAAAEPMPPVPLVPLRSEGVTLILGRDAVALEAAERLKDRLDLTVLLSGEEEVAPPAHAAEYPILRGRARTATGWLGAFAVTVDGYAAPRPSSRAAFRWGPARDGAVSRCDLILDLSGRPPLFPAFAVRAGYLRADPRDAAAVERAIARAAELVGAFDKPRFVAFDPTLCAHARNRRTGCTRCLELCPTGAIAPGIAATGAPGPADSVQLSAEICAGCGACAAVCPTGAATYALPPPEALLRRLRTLLLAYREAGGRDPVLLIHDAAHGEPLLDALARQGDGLPARVLPFRVGEPTQLDLGVLAAALAWGAVAVRVLLPARRPEGAEGVLRNCAYAEAALAALGLAAPGAARAGTIETDDPFALGEALRALRVPAFGFAPARFLALGTPRETARQGFAALREAAGEGAPAVLPLPERAPFGEARVRTEGCTLCLACVSVCPTGALGANPDRPELRFTEAACVQCGLCAATCPEKVIALVPRLNLAPEAAEPRVVKAEEPFRCLACGKPFGTRSSIERVLAKLTAGAGHWMFRDPARRRALMLCEDCRIAEVTQAGLDPYAGPPRPAPRTNEDYGAPDAEG
ncbi:4Fe-4S dicluster domain-containing protein [Caldovatus aquaticus]|uniref:4Fe-4S dicluster domain-containing protein n=1 Tax=Caldovatus aquaticus TaxID=2865671 RepID=A0ABS7F9B6_9PROT|nr:4Fe-4S dicluster domain-containing protein [Caldovatus aquaticus]MBW8271431.1 4Fe-4S dicluster domain-containing protein [Caldovatus aquaticus]